MNLFATYHLQCHHRPPHYVNKMSNFTLAFSHIDKTITHTQNKLWENVTYSGWMLLAKTYPTENKLYNVIISITCLGVDQVSFGVTNDVTYICPPCSYRWICQGQIYWWRPQSPQPVQPGLSHCPSYRWRLLLDEVLESHHRTGKVNTKEFAYTFNEESTVCELYMLSHWP